VLYSLISSVTRVTTWAFLVSRAILALDNLLKRSLLCTVCIQIFSQYLHIYLLNINIHRSIDPSIDPSIHRSIHRMTTDYQLHSPSRCEMATGQGCVATAKSRESPLFAHDKDDDILHRQVIQKQIIESQSKPAVTTVGVVWLYLVCAAVSPALLRLTLSLSRLHDQGSWKAGMRLAGIVFLVVCLVCRAVDQEDPKMVEAFGWGIPCIVAGGMTVWEYSTS
jgi:hypothetical protein